MNITITVDPLRGFIFARYFSPKKILSAGNRNITKHVLNAVVEHANVIRKPIELYDDGKITHRITVEKF